MAGLDFELDIEQRLRGGDAITQLERIEAAYLDAKSANADFTKEAVKATAALEKNAAAIADTKTKLLGAIQAGDDKQVQKLTARFNDLQRAEGKLTADANAAKTALDKQAKTLQLEADKVGLLKKREAERAKAEAIASKSAEQHTRLLQKMTGRVGAAAESISSMGSELGSFGTLLVGSTELVAGLVVALAAIGAAFIAGAAAVTKYAVSLAGAYREQWQTLRAITQSEADAKSLSGAYLQIAKDTGTSGKELTQWTRQLTLTRRQMGLARFTSADLEKGLRAAATASLALDDPSAGQHLIDQMQAGMYTADQLAERVNKQYGDVARQKMLGLGHQLDRLKANFAGLFAHVDIEGILRGFSRLVDLFDASTASGKAIQALFDAIFGPTVGKNADRFFIVLERMILKTEIAALEFGIKVKKTWHEFDKTISSIDLGPLGSLKDALIKLGAVLEGGVENYLPAYVAGLSKILGALGAAHDIGTSFGKALREAYEAGTKWVEKIVGLADAIINGLTDKITNGVDKVSAAVKKLFVISHAKGAKTIDAHSPSRVYAKLGATIPAGVIEGVTDGAQGVGAAVESMLKPPQAPAAGAQTTDNSITSKIGDVHFHGVENGEDALDRLESMLVELFNRRNDQMAAEAPA